MYSCDTASLVAGPCSIIVVSLAMRQRPAPEEHRAYPPHSSSSVQALYGADRRPSGAQSTCDDVWAHGSGKSSLLEAMKLWHDVHSSHLGRSGDTAYHLKGDWIGGGEWADSVSLEFVEGEQEAEQLLKLMYFRTAYRHEPEFALGQINRHPQGLEQARPGRMIDNDIRVSDNYQRLVSQSVEAWFSETDETIGAVALRERLIGQLRDAVRRVLPDVELKGLVDPMSSGTFRFSRASRTTFRTCFCRVARRPFSTYCSTCRSSQYFLSRQ